MPIPNLDESFIRIILSPFFLKKSTVRAALAAPILENKKATKTIPVSFLYFFIKLLIFLLVVV